MYSKKYARLAIAIVAAITLSNVNAVTSFGTFNASTVSAASSGIIDEIEKVGNIKTTTIKADHEVKSVTKKFINDWSSITSAIQTIVHQDGTVSVLSSSANKNNIEIYEFDALGDFIKRISISKELSSVGAFTRDSEGNYYIFYAKPVNEGAFAEQNMMLVKYSPAAKKIKTFYLEAQTSDEKWAKAYSGVKNPFSFGNCKIEISGDMIAVYFAREMFVSPDGLNHQASYGFILDKNTLEQLTGKGNQLMTMPSAGHSFNQYILPIDDGFMFVDHGDVGPRGFAFNKVTKSESKEIVSFTFKQGGTYQYTFAEMGGIVETEDGYIFAGTYEKTANVLERHNDSRNVFILTMDKQLNKISDPIWLTNYKNKDTSNAISPKIAEIGEGKYLLLWQNYSVSGDEANSASYAIIDGSGRIVQSAKELPHVPLNGFDTLRYNEKTGLIHWAVEEGSDRIVLYSFDPLKQAAPIESISTASDWAKHAIIGAIHAQIVPSDLLGSYKQHITRGEFCRLAIRYVEARTGKGIDSYLSAKGKQIDITAFKDTNDKDILAAHALGIVNGTDVNSFTPDGLLNREQAATMIWNMQNVLGNEATGFTKPNFADKHKTSSWATDAVHYVAAEGIMNGVGGNRFDPQGLYTREQAIVTFTNIQARFPH